MPSTLAEAPKPDNEDSEQPDVAEDDDTTDKNGSAASRLNAIVGAATFLSNADPNCKQQMVEIVKKEFYDFTGVVSTDTCMIHYLYNLTVNAHYVIKQLSCFITTLCVITILYVITSLCVTTLYVITALNVITTLYVITTYIFIHNITI